MKKAKNSLTLWLWLTLFAGATGLPCLALAVLFAIKLKYFLMAVSVIISLHGILGGAIYYGAYLRAKLTLRVLKARERGISTPEELSAETGVTKERINEILALAGKKGYAD